MKKLIGIIIAAFALCCMSTAAFADTAQKYLEPVYNTAGDAKSGIKNWEEKTVSEYTVISGSGDYTCTAGWYVASGNINLSKITCTGDVKLLLLDGSNLVIKKTGYDAGSAVDVVWGSLTIYAQSQDYSKMGKLTAETEGKAGIGSPYCSSGIVINGGIITAKGGMDAGIGGYERNEYVDSRMDIIINYGKVTATGGSGAAGIGFSCFTGNHGVEKAEAGNIIINDGEVYATGSEYSSMIDGKAYYGCGIGGSSSDIFGGNIYINGGKITAKGAGNAAAIGGGENWGSVIITGGTMSGEASGNCPFIGAKNIDTIKISGGDITATTGGEYNETEIYSGAPAIGGTYSLGTLEISGGKVVATTAGEIPAIGSTGDIGTFAFTGGTVEATSTAENMTAGSAIGSSFGDVDTVKFTGGKFTISATKDSYCYGLKSKDVDSIELNGETTFAVSTYAISTNSCNTIKVTGGVTTTNKAGIIVKKDLGQFVVSGGKLTSNTVLINVGGTTEKIEISGGEVTATSNESRGYIFYTEKVNSLVFSGGKFNGNGGSKIKIFRVVPDKITIGTNLVVKADGETISHDNNTDFTTNTKFTKAKLLSIEETSFPGSIFNGNMTGLIIAIVVAVVILGAGGFVLIKARKPKV